MSRRPLDDHRKGTHCMHALPSRAEGSPQAILYGGAGQVPMGRTGGAVEKNCRDDEGHRGQTGSGWQAEGMAVCGSWVLCVVPVGLGRRIFKEWPRGRDGGWGVYVCVCVCVCVLHAEGSRG